MPQDEPQKWITLARTIRARGRIGEVAAEIHTDFPERLTRLKEVYLWNGRDAPRRMAVRRCWLHQDRAIFHFAGCDSISQAETMTGLDVQVPFEERAALPSGRHYISDLIGCAVVERTAASAGPPSTSTQGTVPQGTVPLGTVKDVERSGGGIPESSLLVVQTPAGEVLIPMAEEICVRIDTVARVIEVVLPEGLREINQS
jgi:16S rRNA processing protein RimM